MEKKGQFKKGHRINNGRTPWNKGLTKATDSRVAQPWLGKKRLDMIGNQINTGRKHSIEERLKRRESLIGVPRPQEFKDRMKIKMLGKNKGKKPWNYIDGKSLTRERNRTETLRVWCSANQMYKVPNKCAIHHLDQNPMNNNPENLQLMTKRFHDQLHNEYIKIQGVYSQILRL